MYNRDWFDGLKKRKALAEDPMDGTVRREGTLFWTVLLEASTFFSVPVWYVVSHGAWPANEPYRFALVVVAGATMALILCHVVPALCARRLSGIISSPRGSLALWPIGIWLCVGAAISAAQLSQMAGVLFTTWVDYSRRGPSVVAAGVIFAMASTALAWAGPGRQRLLTALCGALGIIVLAGLLAWQWRGLWVRNPQMAFGEPEGQWPVVLNGILTVAVPASVLAFRIGRSGAGTRRLWWSGLLGAWVPRVASVWGCSLAMMAGTRLHWRPSLPIEFTWAMVGPQDQRFLNAAWTLVGLTTLAPAVVCAMWIRDLTEPWKWKWKGPAIAGAFGALALGLGLTSHSYYPFFWSPWCVSVLAGACLLGILCLVPRRRPRRQDAA